MLTVEFPHLLRLMQQNQFDTIYHEHFSYFSLLTVEQVFARHGLIVFDVQELTTHGGSLRIFATHRRDTVYSTSTAVAKVLADERAAGLDGKDAFAAFANQVIDTRTALLGFCIQARRDRKTIAGYGARALYIPPGFEHGFQTLADESEVFYQMTETYRHELARGVRWNDPALYRLADRWPDPVAARRLLFGLPTVNRPRRVLVTGAGGFVGRQAIPLNIASGLCLPVRDVIQKIALQIGRPELVRLGARPAPITEPPRLAAAINRLACDVGFRPLRTLDEGLAETIAWWNATRSQSVAL